MKFNGVEFSFDCPWCSAERTAVIGPLIGPDYETALHATEMTLDGQCTCEKCGRDYALSIVGALKFKVKKMGVKKTHPKCELCDKPTVELKGNFGHLAFCKKHLPKPLVYHDPEES